MSTHLNIFKITHNYKIQPLFPELKKDGEIHFPRLSRLEASDWLVI